MNKHLNRILETALAALLFAAVPALAEPVGDLLPLNDAAKNMVAASGKSLDDVKKEIPSMEDVGLPVYPGSFYTGSSSGSGMLPSIVMASGDSMEQVKEWYAQQNGFTWHDMFGLFYLGDEYEMMQTESVFLQDISEDPAVSLGGLMYDMSGMKTQITISYEPKQAAGIE